MAFNHYYAESIANGKIQGVTLNMALYAQLVETENLYAVVDALNALRDRHPEVDFTERRPWAEWKALL